MGFLSNSNFEMKQKVYLVYVLFRQNVYLAHKKKVNIYLYDIYMIHLYNFILLTQLFVICYRLLGIQDRNTCFLSIQIPVKNTWTMGDNFI
jgi:hypothetical protein